MRVRRSRLVALLSAIACVALAATAVQVSEARPDHEYLRGQVGRPVAVEDGEVLVDDVRVGTQLTRSGEVMDTTPGAFVVVGVTASATGHREVLFGSSRLVTRGPRVYDAFTSQSVRAAPGFAERLDYVFEVDPTAVEDLTLELWRVEIISGYQARVQVHLGITADNAAQWREAAAGRRVEIDTNRTTRALG
ncbi:hypothetical protein SAMN04488543_4326 [Friedmanniella luteola]|uniref:Uncharacterized protein n=1 Tax=Friedmanniella luteola TaxID=546871 RepID=A0A1H2A9X7_9ACTN|nr:hypothetical protein [Friedmanniella luteola]SDT42687.1 hypothetical protein SAMN04488543_4326 [Friedmanniella luteola]